MAEYAFIRFEPSNHIAWWWMPQMAARLKAFAQKLDSKANLDILLTHLIKHFADNSLGLFAIGIFKDSELIGHLLCQTDDYYGSRTLTVLQYELDEALPVEVHRGHFERLKALARQAGARTMVANCQDPRVARVHKIFHGFEDYSQVLTLDLGEEG